MGVDDHFILHRPHGVVDDGKRQGFALCLVWRSIHPAGVTPSEHVFSGRPLAPLDRQTTLGGGGRAGYLTVLYSPVNL